MRKPAIHGRDHGLWGADPIRIGLSKAPLMGGVLGGARLASGFGINGGILYLPNRESLVPLETGEDIQVSFAHADPENSAITHFPWLAARLHTITGLDDGIYSHIEPWISSPFFGGTGGTGTGASFGFSPAAFGGDWNLWFVGLAGVSDDDTDTVHFASAGLELDDDEQFGWDVAGVGHIGYLFHDFAASETGDITISFASGAGSNKAVNLTVSSGTSISMGSVVGAEETNGSAIATVDLTAGVAADEQVIVVSASQGPDGFFPTNAPSRPAVNVSSRNPDTPVIPMFRVGTQLHPVVPYLGGLGQAGGNLDGGSP